MVFYLTAAPAAAGNFTDTVVPAPFVELTRTSPRIVADDAVHDRQSEAGAALEAAAERLEDPVQLLGRDADALVRRR